ncbi:hypothetical protein ACKC9G_10480 [Pokkaliibacter sp. CJK22405]|uniref:hypothetical protein n=1 Tax=Pokkaliibacter sp. CJK22405 TaxID=3384615 RepID=UPI00398497C6
MKVFSIMNVSHHLNSVEICCIISVVNIAKEIGFFVNRDFIDFVEKQVSASAKRVIRIDWQNESFWVKSPEETRVTIWHRLASPLSTLIKNPLLRSTVASGGAEELLAEAARIRLLHQKGMPVPEVVAQSDEWFVIRDGGRSIRGVLKDKTLSAADKLGILQKVAAALGDIHARGGWHGRPALRDILWDGEQVTFIDFEENLAARLDPLLCQVRDLLLFTHSLFRLWGDADYSRPVLNTYRDTAPVSVWEQSIKEAQRLNWACKLLKVARHVGGHDVVNAYLTLRFFSEYDKAS